MLKSIKEIWNNLQLQDRRVLVIGGTILLAFLFYIFIWQPWHKAIASLESNLPAKRQNLVWMQQQSNLVKNSQQGGGSKVTAIKDSADSLLSVIEKTSKTHGLSKYIQQLAPGSDRNDVKVSLSEADFNKWVKWVDTLSRLYDVKVKELSIQGDDDNEQKNITQVRVIFTR